MTMGINSVDVRNCKYGNRARMILKVLNWKQKYQISIETNIDVNM
jgi:hypothetical protein